MKRSYDSISRDVVRDIMFAWTKSDWSFYEQYEFSQPYLDFQVDAGLTFTAIDEAISHRGTGVSFLDTYPLISIRLHVPSDDMWKHMEDVYMLLIDIVRHEIEHITQSGTHAVYGKPSEIDWEIREFISEGLLGKEAYLMLPMEIDANLQGLRLRAKKMKTSLEYQIDWWLNRFFGEEATDQIKNKIKNNWRTRSKHLGFNF